MANDAFEKFWGCTLSKDKKEFTWDPSTETEDDIEHKLQVTSACLGAKVKSGERNLVELTTEDEDGDKSSYSMVSLRAGGKECIHLELGFSNPTKFILKEGTGPISLCGVHLQAMPLDFDEEDSDDSDEDIPDLVSAKKVLDVKKGSPVKRPLEETKTENPAAKKKKPEPKKVAVLIDDDDDDDDDGDDDDDDEEEEEEEMSSLLDGEAEEGSEESEDDDEPEDGDDVDSEEEDSQDDDEEDDDDDDEEEDEEEQAAKKPTKLMNGHSKKAQQNKTPAKNQSKSQSPIDSQKKETKTPQKTPNKKAPVTPKSAGPKKTPDEIKAMLIKSPNLPKTFEKFSNYMRNNMKITDEKSCKGFWEYVQKNKK